MRILAASLLRAALRRVVTRVVAPFATIVAALLWLPATATEPATKPAGAADGGRERRLALVVGNARYKTAPLNNPENDARVIGSTLRRLGFDVAEHVNLDAREFRRVAREFARRVQHEDGVALFYYAGHGVQIEGRNYLLPVDLVATDEDEVKDGAVDIDEIFVSRLERAKAPVRLVILDACRDNPFATRTRSVRGGGLAEMGARGALIAFASAPGATAEDGPPGTNSVYTRHLASEMLVEGIEVEQMFKNVRVKVLRDTQQRQIPWINTSLTANFMFNPGRGGGREDTARREELTRLQALLELREREQRRLEEQLRQLRERSEVAAVTGAPGSPGAPAAGGVGAGSATAALPVAPPSPTDSTAAPASAAPAGNAGQRPDTAGAIAPSSTAAAPTLAPAAPPQRVTQAPTVPPRKPDAATAPAQPAPQPTAATQGPPNKPRPGALSERCAALLIRAQLGETLGPADMAHLQKECR